MFLLTKCNRRTEQPNTRQKPTESLLFILELEVPGVVMLTLFGGIFSVRKTWKFFFGEDTCRRTGSDLRGKFFAHLDIALRDFSPRWIKLRCQCVSNMTQKMSGGDDTTSNNPQRSATDDVQAALKAATRWEQDIRPLCDGHGINVNYHLSSNSVKNWRHDSVEW